MLGKEQAAEQLWQGIESDLDRAASVCAGGVPPRVVFLLGNSGLAMAAGLGTQANGLIELAGGINVFANYAGYKPVSEEALLQIQPDIVLIAVHAPEETPDPRSALRNLGLGHLARNRALQVEALDMGCYLTFGPRTGQAALELAQLFRRVQTLPEQP